MQIRVEDLSMIYNPGLPYETRALDHISVEIKPGEFVAIIGHTGSGKTTLVQQIAGLLEPTSGRVVAVAEDGTETVISEKGKASFAVRRKVGIVFQYPEYQLFEETVLKLVGMDADEIGGESPFELSGGQKRRVAIAGVLAMDPEVLILDEPTAGLDPKGHDDILRMIDRIQDDRNITIILVSHNMDDVAEYADTVLVMNKGSLFMQGDPRYVYCERGRELKSVGLDLPAGPGFLEDLQDLGLDVDIEKLSFDETAEEIIRVVKKKWQ